MRKERNVSTQVQIPLSLITVLDQIADSEQIAFTQVLRRALRKGLEVERAEREAKQDASITAREMQHA